MASPPLASQALPPPLPPVNINLAHILFSIWKSYYSIHLSRKSQPNSSDARISETSQYSQESYHRCVEHTRSHLSISFFCKVGECAEGSGEKIDAWHMQVFSLILMGNYSWCFLRLQD